MADKKRLRKVLAKSQLPVRNPVAVWVMLTIIAGEVYKWPTWVVVAIMAFWFLIFVGLVIKQTLEDETEVSELKG